MAFRVVWNAKAEKNLVKISKDLLGRIFSKIDEVKENPFRFLEHFEDEKVYNLRIGDYRALVDVDFQNKILYIQVFDKMGRVYK